MKEDVLVLIMDKENTEPIELMDEKGRVILFEQVAVIPNENKLYVILKPIDKIEGVEENEAIVFFLEKKDEQYVFRVEEDELIAIEVFNRYYDLLEERWKDTKGV